MRTIGHELSRAIRSTPWIFAFLLIPTLALLCAVVLQPWVPVAYLLRDPLAVAEEATECCSVFYGLVSNLGVILWIASGTACLFTAIQVCLARQQSNALAFLIAGGLFTLWLGMDDLFLVHEDVLPTFGVSERVTYSVYAAAGIAYLLVAWRRILAARLSLFLSAGGCLGASMGIDAVVHDEADMRLILEDGLKFIGIVLWAGFHLASALSVAIRLATGRVVTVALSPDRLIRQPAQLAA